MLTLTTRANSPRRTTQMRPSHRRMRDPLRTSATNTTCLRIAHGPLPRELEGVLDALLAARVVLAETRDAHRIALNWEQAKVERVLGEVGRRQWRNMLPAE
jgi:hypothetical protein